MSSNFSTNARRIIKKIPKGKVATYGQIAAMAGNPRASRMIAGILHLYSEKDNLPWYRVINREGKISLKKHEGYEVQRSLLESEGVIFKENNAVDLGRFQWQPKGRI